MEQVEQFKKSLYINDLRDSRRVEQGVEHLEQRVEQVEQVPHQSFYLFQAVDNVVCCRYMIITHTNSPFYG